MQRKSLKATDGGYHKSIGSSSDWMVPGIILQKQAPACLADTEKVDDPKDRRQTSKSDAESPPTKTDSEASPITETASQESKVASISAVQEGKDRNDDKSFQREHDRLMKGLRTTETNVLRDDHQVVNNKAS